MSKDIDKRLGPLSEHHKRKISKTLKGRALSPLTKYKMSLTRKGRRTGGPLKGQKPKNFLMLNTPESVVKRAAALREKAQRGEPVGVGTARGGIRPDLDNIFFRSRWEANYARYLNFINVKWEYEYRTFWFHEIRKGTVIYTPDFYLPETDEWVEIKGYLISSAKTKLRRFRKYYPEEFEKLKFVIRDPLSKTKSARQMLGFLMDKLHVPFTRIEGYKRMADRFGSIISNWEK